MKKNLKKLVSFLLTFSITVIWSLSGLFRIPLVNFPPDIQKAHATTETFSSAISTTWQAPPGVWSVLVECWGAGGAGGGDSTNGSPGGSGGGGGAYASKTISVTPLTNYNYTVGDGVNGGTGNGTAGTNSVFTGDASVQCLADGGLGGGGNGGAGGAGGTLANSDGTTEYAGGSGFTSASTTGGGGGGSGGTGSTGNSATSQTGAAAVTGGGPGGNGGAYRSGGSAPASGPGGGGGGSGAKQGGDQSGGGGYDGQIRLTYFAVSVLTQNDFEFWEDNAALTPTSIWGTPDIAENVALNAVPVGNDPIDPGDEIRIRMNISVSSADLAAGSEGFILAYSEAQDCTTASSWTDVDVAGGGGTWIFSSDTDVADNTTLTTLLITGSDVAGRYNRSDPTSTNPNTVTTGQDLEWDWHIVYNSGNSPGAKTFCFRMERDDGSTLMSTIQTHIPASTPDRLPLTSCVTAISLVPILKGGFSGQTKNNQTLAHSCIHRRIDIFLSQTGSGPNPRTTGYTCPIPDHRQCQCWYGYGSKRIPSDLLYLAG